MKRYRRAILATCCVPWKADFCFDEARFRQLVRHLLAGGIRDLYIFGTAGEGYGVSEGQFDDVTRVFLEETRAEGVQGMVGLISLSLPTIVERIERARQMGARRFQLTLPSWGTLRDGEMDTFFEATCGPFPDCEFLHYNLQRAGRIVTPQEYGRLAERHANLVATKNSTTDPQRLEGLLLHAPQLQHFITEPGFAYAATRGECGLLISLASLNLQLGGDYFRAGCEGDTERLGAMQQELAAIGAEMKRIVGDSAHMDGAYDKLFCRASDPQFPLRLLPPYSSVSETSCQQFLDFVAQNFPHWLGSRYG